VRPATAYGALAALLVADAALLHAGTPWWALLGAVAAAVAALPRGRAAFLAGSLVGMAFYGALLALAVPGEPSWRLGPLRVGADGALRGLQAALRMAALVGLNVAAVAWLRPARLLEAVRLPRGATAFLAAVLLAVEDLARDFRQLRDAKRLAGGWPRGRLARAREAASLLAPLMVLAHERGEARRDALRLAGLDTGPRFVPLVAVTALAAAGRLAFVALPNVALTYVVVFLGGLLHGPLVGFTAGVLAMVLTDLMLSGPLPHVLVNAPAMGLVGLAGAAFGILRARGAAADGPVDGPTTVAYAASAGILATFLFSAAADAGTWLVLPELRGDTAALGALLVAGLAFNALPALVNGALFAAAVGPVARAFAARRARPASSPSVAALPLDP